MSGLEETVREHRREIARLREERDALLEAAKEAEPLLQAMLFSIRNYFPQYKLPALDNLRAAIKAVEGEKHGQA